MQVILLEKVANLGNLGDVVKVKDGYARNFLIPQGKAKRATPENIKDARSEARGARSTPPPRSSPPRRHRRAKLEGTTVNVTQKAGVDGRLFGSVTNVDIVDALKALGFEVEKASIRMPTRPAEAGRRPSAGRRACIPTRSRTSRSTSSARPWPADAGSTARTRRKRAGDGPFSCTRFRSAEGIDSEIIAEVAATAGKYIFTRVRPADARTIRVCGSRAVELQLSQRRGRRSPRRWSRRTCSNTAATTRRPTRCCCLPLYVGAGRIKNQAHWQTDVLAGWAVGGLSGWYAHSRDVPFMIELLPHGFQVGYRRQF